MQTKYFLHEYLKHVNIDRPTPVNISYNEFPKQNTIEIYKTKLYAYFDPAFVPNNIGEDRHEEDEFKDRIFKGLFTHIRYDLDKNVEVMISVDYDKTIILHDNVCTDIVHVPTDFTHLIGMRVYPEYHNGITREAYILDIQAIEPGFAVIVEYLDDSTYRIILDTEMYFRYNPDDVVIPVKEPNLAEIRKNLLEGRIPYQYESDNSYSLVRALSY